MTENLLQFSFIIKISIYYIVFSQTVLNKIECHKLVEKPQLEKSTANKYQSPYRTHVAKNEFQSQYVGRMINLDQVSNKRQIFNENKKLSEQQRQNRNTILYESQHPIGVSVQNSANIPSEKQVFFDDKVEYSKISENQNQQLFRRHLQYEAQAPFLVKVQNLDQSIFKEEIPNLAEIQFESQSLNQVGVPTASKIINRAQLFDNILYLPKKIIPTLFTDITTSLFKNILQSFQKKFFDDIEKDINVSIKLGLKPNVSSECLNSLKDLQIGLTERKVWAIRMIDSFGKIPSGILDGTLIDYGDFDTCVNTVIPEFQGKYCLVSVFSDRSTKNSSPRYLNLTFAYDIDFTKPISQFVPASAYSGSLATTSICMPSKCSENEVQNVLSKVNSYVIPSVELKVNQCSLRQQLKFTYTQKIIMFAILLLILLELFATYVEVRLRNLYQDKFNKIALSKTTQCIIAFSYYSNTIRLFKRDENPDSIKIFHGMKFISLAWIVFSHTLIFSTKAFGRLNDVIISWGSIGYQIPVNAALATETFFFMSGILVVNSFLKSKSSQFNFIIFVFYRIIRLMPPILFTLGIIFLLENWSTGPIWKDVVIKGLVNKCKTTWWWNVLFLNNIYIMNTPCLFWTWYVAADMQLYLFSYFILILIKRNPERAISLLKAIIVASVIGLIIYNVVYDLPPYPFLIYINLQYRLYYTHMLHSRTYNHVTPYCMGMIIGYFIARKKKIHLSKTMKFFGWCVAILCFLICAFTIYIWNHRGRVATVTESALYGGTHRLLWSIMLSWLVYLCVNGEAGKVNSILAAHIFVPLSRLTYMAFLLHPLVQMFAIGQARHAYFLEIRNVVYFFFGFLITSYMLAFVSSLICESPFSRLLSELISSNRGKSDKKMKENFSV